MWTRQAAELDSTLAYAAVLEVLRALQLGDTGTFLAAAKHRDVPSASVQHLRKPKVCTRPGVVLA